MKRNLTKLLTLPVAASLLISTKNNTNRFQTNMNNNTTLFSRLFPSQNHLSFADDDDGSWNWNWNWKFNTDFNKPNISASLDAFIESFHKLEASRPPNDKGVGIASAQLAFRVYFENKNLPELVLDYGEKASRILLPDETYFSSLTSLDREKLGLHVLIMRNLLFSGIACYNMEMYDESLAYLERASKVGVLLEGLERLDEHEVLWDLSVVENYLAMVKNALGVAEEEIVRHLRKFVEIRERFQPVMDLGLGFSCRKVAVAYFQILEFEEALPFALKALKIFANHFGEDSSEVGVIRYLLGYIYGRMGEYGKAVEQLGLAKGIFRDLDPSSVFTVEAEIQLARYRILLGWYEEGVETLLDIVSHEIKNDAMRAYAFAFMADGYCFLGKFSDARRCAELADQKSDDDGAFNYVFMELSKVYEKLKEPETAMSYLQRMLLTNGKLPLKALDIFAARYFALISSTGKAAEGIPYLKVVVQKMMDQGSEHFQVGNGYRYLGYAYLMSGEPETAAAFLTESKVIMDATVGPHHENSVMACQGLVKAYVAMESYSEAVSIQEIVIERLNGKEPRAQDELDAAVALLEDLKKKAGL